MFDGQCIWEKIFVSLEKLFVFQYSQTIFHLVFTGNIYVFLNFFGSIFLSTSTLQTAPKYNWMRQGLFIFFSHS